MGGIFREKRGQAAVTDALFFLTIVAVVSVLLFTNTMSYGVGLISTSVEYYENTYTISALKSLYAISTPLEPGKYNILETQYNDGLLSILKRDYYLDNNISLTTQLKIMQSLKQIMAPVSRNKNYLFYIYVPQNEQGNPEMVFAGIVTYAEGEQEKRVYLCAPNESKPTGISLDDISKYLQDHHLGQSFAEGRMSLLYKKMGGDHGTYVANTGLITWTATPDLDEQKRPYSNVADLFNNNCCYYEESDIENMDIEKVIEAIEGTCPQSSP